MLTIKYRSKILALKSAAEAAHAIYDDRKSQLAAEGLNSQARYELLKPLKMAEDKAHRLYKDFTERLIKLDLDQIIRSAR